MATTAFGNLPTPEETAAPDVPADMATLANAIDPMLNLKATSQSDRDSRLTSVPGGTIVSTTDGTLQWVKTTSGWATTHSYETTTAFSWGTGVADNGTSILKRINGNQYDLFLNFTYNGSNVTANGAGLLSSSGITVCTLPSGWLPALAVRPYFEDANQAMFGKINPSTGAVLIFNTLPSQQLSSGDSLLCHLGWIN